MAEQVSSLMLQWRYPRWSWVLAFALGGVLLFQLVTLQRALQGELHPLLQGQLGLYAGRLLGYYLPFELLSVLILLACLGWYFRRCMPQQLRLTLPAVLGYELRFLPIVLGSILLLGPCANTLRYLVLHYPHYQWASYFPEWFFTGRMFSNYLVPVLLVGYGLLNGNLLLDLGGRPLSNPVAELLPPTAAAEPASTTAEEPTQDTLNAAAAPTFCQYLLVADERGNVTLPVRELRYVAVAARKQYRAHDRQGRTYELRQPLAELEACLDPQHFLRLNRAVLVNLKCVRSFAHWEKDKYVVRLDDATELLMPRARLRELRTRLAALAAAAT